MPGPALAIALAIAIAIAYDNLHELTYIGSSLKVLVPLSAFRLFDPACSHQSASPLPPLPLLLPLPLPLPASQSQTSTLDSRAQPQPQIRPSPVRPLSNSFSIGATLHPLPAALRRPRVIISFPRLLPCDGHCDLDSKTRPIPFQFASLSSTRQSLRKITCSPQSCNNKSRRL